VHGEVTRLISRGEGTHRITLRLHPADLGDVRVTLTLKDGSVNVSLAAGHDAQKALASGAPELHRLLHAAGATSADIVVKDLPVPTSSRFDLDPGSTGQGRGHTPEQTARTWSGDDGTPARATKPPPANPGTRTPSPGVDVSM
jgi:flagellar hook-length control protein FliK